MNTAPSMNQKLISIGVSKPYASQLVNKKRAPSLTLALKIYRELGMKMGPIVRFTSSEISALEKMGVKRLASQ